MAVRVACASVGSRPCEFVVRKGCEPPCGKERSLPLWTFSAAAAMLTMLLEGLQVMVKAVPDPRRLVSAVDTALLSLASVRG